MVEFHVHGGRAVVAAVARALASFDGVREAEPGEFTRRAFIAGKIDLTEVEGLADLLAAETEEQRAQALDQSTGALRQLYDGWRHRLILARGLMEAGLDFVDEDDVPEAACADALREAADLASTLRLHLADAHRGERLRQGFQVVLLGRPNAGKSSLLNALARRDVAIVSHEAGTTRDLVEVHLDLGGFPVTLVDTAGLRETSGDVEREGMRRALSRGRDADLVLWLVAPDGSGGEERPDVGDVPIWRVDSKCDLVRGAAEQQVAGSARFPVSSLSGLGIDRLVAELAFEVGRPGAGAGSPPPTRDRHRRCLESALRELELAQSPRLEAELCAEHLRSAGDHLGRLTGRIDVEDLLDVIFGSFCIGK